MARDRLRETYFEWIFDKMCGERFAPEISFRMLFEHLHRTKFRYSILKDRNRAEDGVDLRYRFALTYANDPIEVDEILKRLDGPCSVLEMMVALAIRAEETIMDDPNVGDRTSQWFWNMIGNLRLGNMIDEHFDRAYVIEVVERFLDREYTPDGKGGLFFVRDCDRDLREVEIWYQLCWYLDSIT